jgi:transcription-repair coupling factor (superfamily II helicase)
VRFSCAACIQFNPACQLKDVFDKGFQFAPVLFAKRIMKVHFIYEDTPDQVTYSRSRADMRDPNGSVWFVAMSVLENRAICVRQFFKSSRHSKQVAILVPTTILAYQHCTY